MNQADVQRCVRRIECLVLVLPELGCDRFESINQPRRSNHGRRAERWISAVSLAAFHDYFRERVTFARANRLQRSGFADDAVTNTQRLVLSEYLSADETNLLIGSEHQRQRFSGLARCKSSQRGGDEAFRIASTAPVK